MKTLPKGLFCLRKASTRHSNGPQSERIEKELGEEREELGGIEKKLGGIQKVQGGERRKGNNEKWVNGE